MKDYDFDEKNGESQVGIDIVKNLLKNNKYVSDIKDIQTSYVGKTKDIDLTYLHHGILKRAEVKFDLNWHTGNFFFETISNESKNTLGCFLLTEADVLFYCFSNFNATKKIFAIKMPEAREWFLKNIDRFPEAKTSTKRPDQSISHITVGRIVPIVLALGECSKHIREIKLT